MQFQHTTPMPSGVSMMTSTASIGVPQMHTISALSGEGKTIIPGDISDQLSINLIQLLLTWGDVASLGRFEIRSKGDPTIIIYQDQPSGVIILPCWSIQKFLGRYGLRVMNSSTGGEYSITVNYTVREL
jgi:hypothetical protein